MTAPIPNLIDATTFALSPRTHFRTDLLLRERNKPQYTTVQIVHKRLPGPTPSNPLLPARLLGILSLGHPFPPPTSTRGPNPGLHTIQSSHNGVSSDLPASIPTVHTVPPPNYNPKHHSQIPPRNASFPDPRPRIQTIPTDLSPRTHSRSAHCKVGVPSDF